VRGFQALSKPAGIWDPKAKGNLAHRDTTEGILTAALSFPEGGGGEVVSVARVKREEQVARHALPKLPVGSWKPARRCPRGRRGMSESGTCEVKAAPADEARAVEHSRRREALPQTGFVRGSRFFRASESTRAREPWTHRSKLARANS